MDFQDVLFIMSAFVCVVSAAAVAFSANILYAAFALLACLLGVAGVYLSLQAPFLATVQVIVYIGGIVVLALFAIMLSRDLSGVKSFQDEFKQHAASWSTRLIALVLSGTLFYLLFWLVSQGVSWPQVTDWEPVSTTKELGRMFLGRHILAFEFSSLLLLGALIGAAVLARPKKEGM